MESVDQSNERVTKALEDLHRRLFGFVPDSPSDYVVRRAEYNEAMHAVQKEHGLVEGDPDFMFWIVVQLSRSPRIEEDGELVNNESGTTDGNTEQTMGGTAPSATDGRQ